MPVMRTPADQPGWVRWSNFGFGTVTDADAFDRHFHDADEYWIILSGRARVLSEGAEYEVGPGDILCTRMGDEHDILEILDGPLETFWFEDELKGQKRPGHLHHHPQDAP
ncbi:MAG TPA: AraC family ligand binding domain-containing protein [Thermomicrobiales bacterium]|jgi:mannose-6-phosphate isomerase-like protein (cupin superfamily)|nr:AraC family ligand binding domain-containing protein [Thermomicrobiales bacterium]